ncbi:MAG: ATP-binding protein [Patescibacteria group bacterium]
MTREELNILLAVDAETEHLEFKESSGQISILGKDDTKTNKKSLYGYCVAMGNEGGGKLVFGVKDKINPATGMRDVVGTNAILNTKKAREEIYKVLDRSIDIDEIPTEQGKVQIVHIPAHSIGQAFRFYGVPLRRNGEELVEMDDARLREIIMETRGDFSAHIASGAMMTDLDTVAVAFLKKKWLDKKQDDDLKSYSDEEVLRKLLLVTSEGITNACLLLVGTTEALARHIACAEIFLEWKSDESRVGYERRDVLREPFVLAQEKIWKFVDSRNTSVPFREGFFERDIWAYDKESVDEAVLNAFAHREYLNRTEPVYVRVSPERLSVKSAGGFLPGVTPENALYVEGKWRNRRLMEALGEIGLVERAGVGLDRIYRATISQGKGLPDFDGTNAEYVVLNVPAKIKDLNFAYYLQKIQEGGRIAIDPLRDFIELECIRENGKAHDRERLAQFLSWGIIEKVGSGRGVHHILAKSFYEFVDSRGEYTRKRWLSKEQQKQVLINYLDHHGAGRKSEFRELFERKLSDHQIFTLLNDLRVAGLAMFTGRERSRTGDWRLVKSTEKQKRSTGSKEILTLSHISKKGKSSKKHRNNYGN